MTEDNAPPRRRARRNSTPKPAATRPSEADLRPSLDQVGPRLRAAREARGLSLREMARRIKVSASLVSQVETGKASPSVGTLYSLVSELGLSLDEVMAGAAVSGTDVAVGQSRPVEASTLAVPWIHSPGTASAYVPHPLQSAKGRPAVKLRGVTWERLTYEDDPLVEFLHVNYSPGSSSCSEDDLMRHGGREYGHVISGRLVVRVAFDVHEMGPGDSINFDSLTPHRLANPYKEPCQAVWVVVNRAVDRRIAILG